MKHTNSKSEEMLRTGSFWELILKLSLPAVVIILIMIIYNMADTYFIGQTGDPDKLSAISLCMPVFTVLSGIGTLFGNGGSTTISIALGEKDYTKISNITTFCFAGVAVVGLAYFALVFFLVRPLCELLGADDGTMEYALQYLKVFSFASPFVLFSNTFGNIIRADGDAASAMLANIAGTIANIVLDALFILGFHWDVFGAAFATVLGNVLAAALVLLIIIRKKPHLLPHRRDLLLTADIVVPVLTLGLPMTFSTILNSVSSTIQNRLMISHGSVCLAAQSVAGKMGLIVTMLIMGFCMGIQPAISYNYGAKNKKRMDSIVRDMAIFSITLGLVLTVMIFFTKDALVKAFIDNDEVIAYGQVFVMASIIVGPIYGIYQICQTFLQSTGKVNYAIICSLLEKGLVYLPVLFIMNASLGAYGIAFSHAVTMVFSIFAAVILAVKWHRSLKF